MNLFKPPLPNAREHGTIPTCLSGLSWELKDTIWVTVPRIVPGARINPWNLQGSNQSLPRSPSGFTCGHHVQSYEVFDVSMAGLTWTSQARMLQNLRGRGDMLACVDTPRVKAEEAPRVGSRTHLLLDGLPGEHAGDEAGATQSLPCSLKFRGFLFLFEPSRTLRTPSLRFSMCAHFKLWAVRACAELRPRGRRQPPPFLVLLHSRESRVPSSSP